MKSNLIDIECRLLVITDKAICVTMDDDVESPEKIWLPKSQIEFENSGIMLVEVTLPEWLAIEKGMV